MCLLRRGGTYTDSGKQPTLMVFLDTHTCILCSRLESPLSLASFKQLLNKVDLRCYRQYGGWWFRIYCIESLCVFIARQHTEARY